MPVFLQIIHFFVAKIYLKNNILSTKIAAYCEVGILLGDSELTCDQFGNWIGENDTIPRCIQNIESYPGTPLPMVNKKFLGYK